MLQLLTLMEKKIDLKKEKYSDQSHESIFSNSATANPERTSNTRTMKSPKKRMLYEQPSTPIQTIPHL